ncbi:MAG: universal stress protein [Candidatus Aureabacteria bacterium]|nr:universal stress protein [Candidatus Auribacterota bacterium]
MKIKIRKILCPTDFSDFSLYALKYAISFAETYRAELYLLHVVDLFLHDPAYFAPYVPDRSIFAGYEQDAKKRLAEIAEKHVPKGVPTETILREGRAFVEIVRCAREKQVEMIVIATHGRTGLSHAMFGSTAEKVIRKAPCPVLSVKHPEHEFVMP